MNFDSVKVLAPAKVNICLDIVKKRDDGYHEISTVMQAVSLYDNITVSLNSSGKINIFCNDPEIPCDEQNIAYKCAIEFFRAAQEKNTGLQIDIEKFIPSQAGLAGGSTDGAATLIALNKLYNKHLDSAKLCEIAEYVGSDLPFCINGGTQLAVGTGTILKRLPSIPKCYIVICKPEINVSTKAAYLLFDSKNPKDFLFTDEVVKMIYRRDIRAIAGCMYNEFETLSSIQEVFNIKKIMRQNKAIGASMSGSGSAVFGIFLKEKQANKCADILKETYKNVFVCEPVKNGCKIV